jgi:hypothetical protein
MSLLCVIELISFDQIPHNPFRAFKKIGLIHQEWQTCGQQTTLSKSTLAISWPRKMSENFPTSHCLDVTVTLSSEEK